MRRTLRTAFRVSKVYQESNILTFKPAQVRTVVEQVRRKKVKPPKPGDNKTGNLLIDNAGTIGLAAFGSLVFYFYRGWKGGHNEDAAAEIVLNTLTISTGEINELRSSNPRFDLYQYESFCAKAWNTFPQGRLTAEQFKAMVGTELQHLIRSDGSKLPPHLLGQNTEFPIKGWYALDRVIRRHPKDRNKNNTYRLTDLLTSLSLCVDGDLEDVLRALYTVCLLDQQSENLELSLHTFPNLVQTFINTNVVPSRQQTRIKKNWLMYEYEQATAKDIAKRTIDGCLKDWDEKHTKGSFTQFKETIGWSKPEKEENVPDTLLRDVYVPEIFGSPLPLTVVEWVTSTFNEWTGNSPSLEEMEDLEELETIKEAEQAAIEGAVRYKEFYWMMTSRHLCAMGSCHKLKKAARERAKKGITEEESTTTLQQEINYRRVAVNAEDLRRKEENLRENNNGDDTTLKSFIPSTTFQGFKEGYYFANVAPNGLGYHRDYFGSCIKETEKGKERTQ